MALRSNDRILVLERLDKDNKKDGILDPKVFTGENNLHCYIDQGMWYFKMERGLIPGPLRQKYTSFRDAKQAAETYFGSKNIRIKDVLDDA